MEFGSGSDTCLGSNSIRGFRSDQSLAEHVVSEM